MKKVVAIFLLAAGTPAYAQDHNLGFESWGDHLTAWFSSEPGCTIPENGATSLDQCQLHGWSSWSGHGITRTTDAHSGDYAVVVHMWYFGALGQLSLGECHTDGEAHPPQKVNLPDKLYGISGYYKFIVDSVIAGDMHPDKIAAAHIMTYRINASTGILEPVTHDSIKFDKADAYRPFQLAVHYPDPLLVPDSVSIWFESNMHGSGAAGCANSHQLYLDDIELHYDPLSIGAAKHGTPFMIYPNPADDKVHINYESRVKVDRIQLLDVLGRTVKRFDQHETLLDVSNLPPGVYLLDIQTKEWQVREKLLIR